jgi:rubrerythrin
MLVGNGYKEIYNLTGGIKAWGKEVAVGAEDTGLHLFTREESPEEAIIIGFGLEMGLRDFYLSMLPKVSLESTKLLFKKLADIEILHQQRLVELYKEMTGTVLSIEEFAEKIAEPAMEGGLTTEEYLQLYPIDLNSELEVLGLAMAIEAQALDLYMRAADNSKKSETRQVLLQIAEEERNHIEQLSSYIDHQQEVS